MVAWLGLLEAAGEVSTAGTVLVSKLLVVEKPVAASHPEQSEGSSEVSAADRHSEQSEGSSEATSATRHPEQSEGSSEVPTGTQPVEQNLETENK